MARPGRRPGPSGTRAAVLAAARELFAEHGYDGATIRAIATRAGVDPALVHHFFGAKERVFVAAMELPFDPVDELPNILAGPRAGLGERLTRFFLAVWRDPDRRAPFVALMRSAMTNEQAAQMFRQFVSRALLSRVADALDLPRLPLEVAMAQLIGIVMLRHVLRLEPMASATEDELVALAAPTVQRLVDGDRTVR